MRPGLRGGAGRRGHRRVTGVSPGVLRAGLPVPLRRRRKRYFPRHVAGRPVPAGRPVAGTLRHSGSCSRPWGRPGGARPPADPGSRAGPVSFHGPSDPVASRSGPAGARLRPERHSASAVVGRAWRPRQGRREPASCRGLGPASRCHQPSHFRPCVHVRKPLGSRVCLAWGPARPPSPLPAEQPEAAGASLLSVTSTTMLGPGDF